MKEIGRQSRTTSFADDKHVEWGWLDEKEGSHKTIVLEKMKTVFWSGILHIHSKGHMSWAETVVDTQTQDIPFTLLRSSYTHTAMHPQHKPSTSTNAFQIDRC